MGDSPEVAGSALAGLGMTRILALCLILAACGCTSQPIAPNAQAQIDALQSRYVKALGAEHGICSPLCYQAAKAIVMANSDRTATSIAIANEMMAAWETEGEEK